MYRFWKCCARFAGSWGLLTATVLSAGCRSGHQPVPLAGAAVPVEAGAYFVDVTAYSGIDFVHTLGDDHLSNIVETVGSGAAFLDYDRDGDVDLYVANGTYWEGISMGEHRPDVMMGNRLYRNRGDDTFEDVTKQARLELQNYSMGVAVADYDNDGYPDLYVCNYGPNVLYRNNGDGTFSNVTARSGMAGNHNTVGAVWFDYDNDGRLDLFVGNYLQFDPRYNYYYQPDGFPPPMAYPGEPDVLYRNLGDGRFEDVTEQVGLYDPDGRMMGVAAADYDEDGWVDLYVANDAMANALLHNEGGRRFVDLGVRSGTAFTVSGEETSSMAVDFADYDFDGKIDLWVSDIHFSGLYRNEGDHLFTDVTVEVGIGQPSGQYDGWGSAFFDYDNDGDLDIFKANGDFNHLYGHEDQVFRNRGDGTFEDASLALGSYFHRELVGRGAAFGDYDNDGDVDVFVNNLNDRPVLLRNEALDGNNWLQLLLVGTASNRDGVGARVAVTAGGRTQVKPKQSASGYLSTNDPRLHFGLGLHDVVERIEIRWPSGTVQTLENVPANQVLTVTEGSDPMMARMGMRTMR